ncbi:M28 family peptidase [Roseibacillus ishigakijimensis]|uniref:M28 family peptidase n=1 Tax=Roseibacillus ishigakijimensis TaxID=454146 RepID=A0A934RQX9_9BACT|nr:M28 family peptidase [Roseibacillus ishigakijimensis]MBK1832635.1 M28 family peptidase [Roseibacillus ishigakijimensis]
MIRFCPIFLLIGFLSACQPEDPAAQTPAGAPSTDPVGSPRAHTARILSFGPRPPGSAAAREVRAYVTKTLQEAGWVVGTQTFEAETPLGRKSFTNLLARFPAKAGADVWKARMEGLLCAHLDSKFDPDNKFLGADDAASACGLILTLARELAAEPERASRLELIFFDGEEAFGKDMGPTRGGIFDGIYGSRAYAQRWRAASDKPRFGLLLDMVGHRDLRIRVPADSPRELVAVMNRAAEKAGQRERFGIAAGSILDDHVPLNQAGIPTLDLIGDFARSDWWHTRRDNLDLISAESLAITQAVVWEMLAELLPPLPPGGE